MTFEPTSHFPARRQRVDDNAADLADHWLDEALCTVPLPDGFLSRMTAFAHETSLVLAGGELFAGDFHDLDNFGGPAGPTSHRAPRTSGPASSI